MILALFVIINSVIDYSVGLHSSSYTGNNGRICTVWESGRCISSREINSFVDFESDYFWLPVSWSPCTKPCGGGKQKAELACFANNLTKVPVSYCKDLPTFDIQQIKPCNVVPCPTYKVYKSPWSDCSKTCGTGYQTREVVCMDNLGSLVAPEKCDLEDHFLESQPCNTNSCNTSYWTVPQWSYCDSPCGGGKQKRIPTCYASSSEAATCTGPQPETERPCNTQSCLTHAWLVGPWRPCPYSCDATATRLVQCVDGYGYERPESECPGKRPSSSISCVQPHISCTGCLHKCFGNGVCQRDTCYCFDGWRGKYCQTPSNCSGFLGYSEGGRVECCDLVDVNQKCCKRPLLDKDGNCCNSGKLDIIGICDGASTMIDFEGKPCSTLRDEKGICCKSGILDECYICDGDGTTCATNIALYLNVTGNSQSVQDENAFNMFLTSAMDHVANKLHISNEDLISGEVQMLNTAGEECNLKALPTSPCSENGVLNGIAIVNVTLLPSSRSVFTSRKDVLGALQPGPLSPSVFPHEVLNADLLFVGDVRRRGVCGNGLCERGERCTADGYSATTGSNSCCLQDCPYVSKMCPGIISPCSGNGVCLESTGHCDCFQGYAGSDCSHCSYGWIRIPSGGCIMLPDMHKFSTLAAAYRGDLQNNQSLPLTTRKGFDKAAKIILFVLAGICLVLLFLLALAANKERHAAQMSPEIRVSTIRVPSDAESNDRDRHPESNTSEYDVIPITPMTPPRSVIEEPLDETPYVRKWSSRRSLFGSSSSRGTETEMQENNISINTNATGEDLTEEEQTIMREKAKKEGRFRGKDSQFVSGYLTDSESEEDEEKQTQECTPESPAVVRLKNF